MTRPLITFMVVWAVTFTLTGLAGVRWLTRGLRDAFPAPSATTRRDHAMTATDTVRLLPPEPFCPVCDRDLPEHTLDADTRCTCGGAS